MKQRKLYYKNIFLYASLQFSGNIEEYFKNHTENLVVFIVMPRVKNKFNLIRYYHNSVLFQEQKVTSSSNIFIYYFLWYVQYLQALFRCFPRKEKVVIITFHPLTFFLMGIQHIFRNIKYVYWIGDYFPPVNFSLWVYEKIKKGYHDDVSFSCYLSDKINKKMNGKVLKTELRRTVMWGVKPKKIVRSAPTKQLQILFVGLLKPSQGIEKILLFLKDHNEYKIKILGICEKSFYNHLQKLIRLYGITKRVYFPNKFLSDEELESESKSCHVGLALYDMNLLNATNYADPGKVKSYAELGLPIIMSNISDATKYISKFKCGEVINSIDNLDDAFIAIKNNYKNYQDGLKKYNEYFFYESYYKKAFSYLEKLW